MISIGDASPSSANADKAQLKNIETVLGSDVDPKLPAGQLDLVLLVDVYHEFTQPQKMLRKFGRLSSPLGALSCWNIARRSFDPIITVHKMTVAEVKRTEAERLFSLKSSSRCLANTS